MVKQLNHSKQKSSTYIHLKKNGILYYFLILLYPSGWCHRSFQIGSFTTGWSNCESQIFYKIMVSAPEGLQSRTGRLIKGNQRTMLDSIIATWGRLFHHQMFHRCQSKGETQGCEQNMTLKGSEKPA